MKASLLKPLLRLGASLLEFVTGGVVTNDPTTPTAFSPAAVSEAKPPVRTWKVLDRAEAERALRFALTETLPPSLQQVTARLGRDGNTLRYQFGDLCKAIVQRYAAYEKIRSTNRREAIEDALRQVLNESEPPSTVRVAARLGYDVKTLTTHCPDLCREISSRHTNGRKNHWKEVQLTLQRTLVEQPPPSVLKVAERLGLSKSSLYKHFPILCSQIATRYVNHRRRHSAAY